MITYFISGHLDLTQAEFDEHYLPRIREAWGAGGSFVVGDAQGADLLAQGCLKDLCADVTVFHMLEKPRHCKGHPTHGGFTSDAERDAAMTAHSQRDIAWVRPGRERSGTAVNLARRKLLEQAADEHLFEILDDIKAKEGSSPV